ncbi:hypothetical protein QTH97_23605 [Variovorax sp. J22R24]|uniref:hypothetical protein n=1 Tax=Variovorax gracilis TaxID=3053502 RepID=UPI002575286F|nr:hypothetical protein [Variovorax sp. J22R24]MDM0107954.1 hypothetical protein [Variovorax sp. J22R24]
MGARHFQAMKALSAALAIGTAGCVTVHIEEQGGEVRTVRQVGVLRVELSNPAQAIAGSVSGIGVVGAPLGWSVGYTTQRWALMGSECRAVIWVAPGGLDERTRSDLVRAAGVCLIEAEESTRTLASKGEPL